MQITLAEATRLAERALETRQPYAFMRLLPALLQAEPQTLRWPLAYARALEQLGLGDAAREVGVAVAAAGGGKVLELAGEQARLAALRGGRTPWTSRRRRFEANLAIVRARWPEAARAVANAVADAAQRYELFVCHDGNAQVRPAGEAWPPAWFFGLEEHAALAARQVDLPPRGVVPFFVSFDGLGLGYHVEPAYRQTQRVFLDSSGMIYLVEPDAAWLAVVLHIHDWRELLTDPRVQLFAGAAAHDELAQLLRRQPEWPLPTAQFDLQPGGPPRPRVATVVAEIAAEREAEATRLRGEIERHYSGRDAAWWARRFGGALEAPAPDGAEGRGKTTEPLRVLGFTSRFTTFLQYSMRDCLDALGALGCRTRLLIEPEGHLPLDDRAMLAAVHEFQPDLVLILSRMRHEFATAIPACVPAVTWDQDGLPWVFRDDFGGRFGENDFLMGVQAAVAPRRFGWPAQRCRYCELAASERMYGGPRPTDEELAPYRCDVSYVSHQSATVEEDLPNVLEWLPDDLTRRVFERALPRLLPDWRAGGPFPGPIDAAVTDAIAELDDGERSGSPAAGLRTARLGHASEPGCPQPGSPGSEPGCPQPGFRASEPGCPQPGRWELTFDQRAALYRALARVGDRAFRHTALGWVADWAERTGRRLHVYGNGWERHPRLARFARGPAANGDELRRIYHASTLNLQLIGWGFIHQRALDGLMSGAFFLSRRSTWDAAGATARGLLRLLAAHGIRDAAGFAALPDMTARGEIERAATQLGYDVRALCPDAVASLEQLARQRGAAELLPEYERIAFDSAAAFGERAERYLRDADERSRLAGALREAIRGEYSYERRMREMLEFVAAGYRVDAGAEGAGRLACPGGTV